jgi:hypothetical protein
MFLKQYFGSVMLCCIMLVPLPGVSARQGYAVTEPPVQAAHETPDQLQQLVAPIALYPDDLVGQILAAATYPAEIVEAERWLKQNQALKGAALAQAVDDQPWDSSTKGLTEFPKVLANMDKNLAWTSSLGDVYINQPQDVMAAVQVMRQRATAAGNLQTNAQQTVSNQDQSIAIQPADPQIVYVPAYNPWGVYGAPMTMYPGWAPYPGLYLGGPGFEFGLGFGFDYFGGFGWGWNSWGMDWRGHNVEYNHRAFASLSPTFMQRGSLNRERAGSSSGSPSAGLRSNSASNRSVVSSANRSVSRGAAPGTRSSAFSSFDHGGVVRSNSSRGQSSFGGGSRGGGGGGGHSSGGGGHGGGGGRR